MNQSLQSVLTQGSVQSRNRVLRNTYALLALSMLPTVLGAWAGVASGFTGFTGRSGFDAMIFLAVCFGFFYAIEKNKDSGLGVVLLLAFTGFMGLMLSRLLGFVLGSFSNGAQLITIAFGGTAVIFAGMATLASTIKRDISGLGRWLFAGALLVLVAGLANIFLQMPALMLTVLVLMLAVFSAFILYDVKRVIDGGETNYVSATLAIYLDIYNVFQALLSLLSIFGGERD